MDGLLQIAMSTGKKYFVCLYGNCAKECKRKWDYKQHYRSHLNIRPYKCRSDPNCKQTRGLLRSPCTAASLPLLCFPPTVYIRIHTHTAHAPPPPHKPYTIVYILPKVSTCDETPPRPIPPYPRWKGGMMACLSRHGSLRSFIFFFLSSTIMDCTLPYQRLKNRTIHVLVCFGQARNILKPQTLAPGTSARTPTPRTAAPTAKKHSPGWNT